MTERRSSFAQADDSFADRAGSAREYRRRSKQAGIAASSDRKTQACHCHQRQRFSVQHCIGNLQLFGYAGSQIGETLHFISAARNEAAAVTVQMGKRPKPIHALARKSTRRFQRDPGGEPG